MLEGILSAMLTPFTADDKVDEDALRALVDRGAADGLAGLIVGGGTGEFATLNHQERKQVLEIVVEQNDGRMDIVAQTGATTTREAAELSAHAQQVGAAALMLATPYYEPLTFDNVLPYFKDVARASTLPIVAYNFPPAMNFAWQVDTLETLLREVPSVKFLKDSSGETVLMDHFDSPDPEGFTVFNGEDTLVGDTLLRGSKGAIVGAANVAGPGLVTMFRAAQSGDKDVVASIARELKPLFESFQDGPYNGKLKAVLRILGHDIGVTRAPYLMPDDAQVKALEAIIEQIDPTLLTATAAVAASQG
ncbi:dihydrodipicolinate synthase family protein [Rhodococcus sp. NPDC057529]|uniref:dihydrodipicolinate synthase family protein n=1 Tax=Rhodococcus sp. NPDC057529 TaxID=3346158 RepID=UPI0036711722